MPDPTHYTYRVAWSVEDGEHVATVAEFPSLSWLAPTPVEALAGLADVVRDVLADLAASGEPVPAPLSERAYSGRFVVRVPAEVHRRLVREAAEQHVSLNRLVSDRLARALSSGQTLDTRRLKPELTTEFFENCWPQLGLRA
jgi:predicted RNase H-like HicB family nuclease